jgi:L-2-hydroxyglutarate oxidase LhgO
MKERVYDVVIIGGGIVGLAALRDLCLWYDGLSVLLLERDDHLCGQASGHNSGILCTGYDAPKDSLERRMLKEANCMYEEVRRADLYGRVIVVVVPVALPNLSRHLHNIGSLVAANEHKSAVT